ncbi:MAG: ferrochelatase, partial [bacterium]|nr:ferrochelatase [bacterium]
MMKVDVILVTYGEPPLPVFSDQWDFSKRILRKLTRLVAPIPHAVIPLLGALRGIKRVRQWKQEGFTSPLEAITQAQADVLSPLLCELFPEHEWSVTPAYEFRDPTLAQRLDERIQNGTERLVIVPLYVLHSDFTDGITARDLRTYQAQAKQPLPPTTLLSFRPHLDTLAEIMAGYIRTQVRALGLTPEACRETALLCGCHGTGIHPP